jgi:hypothetical protein
MTASISRSLAVILLLVGALTGCEPGPSVYPNVTAAQQADASGSMGLTFPPETRFLFYSRASRGPDGAIWLKIELPAKSLPFFLAQPTLAGAPWKNKDAMMSGSDDWSQWQPERIKKYRYSVFELPQAKYLRVLIDEDTADPKVVYLFWHET